MDKVKFLEYLDDPDIAKKIKDIACGNSVTATKVKTKAYIYTEEDLQNQLATVKRNIESAADDKINRMQNQFNYTLEQKQNELDSAKKKADDFDRNYRELIDKYNGLVKQYNDLARKNHDLSDKYKDAEYVYSLYSGLDDVSLKWFDGVLHAENSHAESFSELITRAVQKENLMFMWDIITSHINGIIEKEGLCLFNSLFEECFKLYEKTSAGRAFLIIPEIGIEYDPLKYSKTADSRSSGKITDVIFPGYSIGNENRKPIVRVK